MKVYLVMEDRGDDTVDCLDVLGVYKHKQYADAHVKAMRDLYGVWPRYFVEEREVKEQPYE